MNYITLKHKGFRAALALVREQVNQGDMESVHLLYKSRKSQFHCNLLLVALMIESTPDEEQDKDALLAFLITCGVSLIGSGVGPEGKTWSAYLHRCTFAQKLMLERHMIHEQTRTFISGYEHVMVHRETVKQQCAELLLELNKRPPEDALAPKSAKKSKIVTDQCEEISVLSIPSDQLSMPLLKGAALAPQIVEL
jgi:hypothetical protein